MSFGRCEQILRGLVRRVRPDRDRERVLEHLADIVEGFRIVAHALHQIGRIGDRRRRPEAERVSRPARRLASAPKPSVPPAPSRFCTTTLLSELLGKRCCDRAADQIDAAATGRKRNDDLDGAGGVFLRAAATPIMSQQSGSAGQHRFLTLSSSRLVLNVSFCG